MRERVNCRRRSCHWQRFMWYIHEPTVERTPSVSCENGTDWSNRLSMQVSSDLKLLVTRQVAYLCPTMLYNFSHQTSQFAIVCARILRPESIQYGIFAIPRLPRPPTTHNGAHGEIVHEQIRCALTAMCAFVPYSFKELKDVDVVDFSAMRQFEILQYIASLQRHCVPSDVFFLGIFNTDASDERLLITGADGRSNVIRWSEVMTAFGGEHSDEDEFRGTKIMHRQLLPYKPSAFLPETVEKNLNKGLVSGKDYEDREAAPYGPTYYLMTLIAEREARSAKDSRKTVEVVWGPVFVHLLYTFRHRIFAGTSYAESEPWVRWRMISKEGDITLTDLVEKFSVPITDINIIREKCKLKDPDELPEADLADQVDKTPKKLLPKKSKPPRHVISDTSDEDNRPQPKRQKANTGGPRVRLVSKKPNDNGGQPRKSVSPTTITNIADLAATLSEDVKHILENRYQSLISQLDNGPENWKQKFQALQQTKAAEDGRLSARVKSLQDSEDKLRTALAAGKADNDKLRAKVSDLEYHVNMLNESVNKAKQTAADHATSLKDANQTRQQIASLQDEVSRFKEQQVKWLSDKATLQKIIETLRADKHEAFQAKESAETELRAAMVAAEGYKKSMDSELDTAAAAQLEKDRLNDEISTLKFSLERAEKNTLLARQELASVRVQLRRFQIHEGSSSAREKST
ncbi:hypothetical protein R1sor_024579 [Riccia sorocarpa]|uniref:Uncharacterized protein n=1 Tax=Riccia sorocarpa TaxID=122646 RepID=A0ABD3GRN8_9MARC